MSERRILERKQFEFILPDIIIVMRNVVGNVGTVDAFCLEVTDPAIAAHVIAVPSVGDMIPVSSVLPIEMLVAGVPVVGDSVYSET
jgi:hypothetical protein